MMAKLRQVL